MRFCTLAMLLLSGIYGYAQENVPDTSLQLSSVTITASRLVSNSAGTKVTRADSVTLAEHVTEDIGTFLANESPLFIKSYGLGSVATSAFRGGSAQHTAILWNGFNLNNPMHGQCDFSLLPVAFFDEIAIQYGGNSALWGSGAMGGAIHLNNHPAFEEHLSVKAAADAGSFSALRQQLHATLGHQRISAALKLIHADARNDFPYQDADRISRTLAHAATNTSQLMVETHFIVSATQRLNFNAWLQTTTREVPPTLVQAQSTAVQDDRGLRFTAQWDKQGKRSLVQVRSAFFDEEIIYDDSLQRVLDTSRSQSLIAEAEYKYKFNAFHEIIAGVNNTYTRARAPGYRYRPDQMRTAAFASYAVRNSSQKYHGSVSGRQEFIAGNVAPFTWSVSAEAHPVHWLKVHAAFARVYRTPTFNDLYWIPGGNPDLLSERGNTQEAGIAWTWPVESIKLNSDVTVFHKLVSNWILWVPGNIYWSPQNILKVNSRGMETNHHLTIDRHQWKFRLSGSTNYVRSTHEEATNVQSGIVGKQLIYVPVYSGAMKFFMQRKNFSLTYRHQYTGYRYTSNDNTQYLNPYDLGSLSAGYVLTKSQYRFSFHGEMHNLWNTNYQVIAHRAMPGRNFSVGLSVEFHTP